MGGIRRETQQPRRVATGRWYWQSRLITLISYDVMVLIFLQIVDNHSWWCLITLKVLFLIKGCSITWVCKTVVWTEYYNKYYYVSILWYCSFDERTCKNKTLDTHSSLRWQGFIIPNVCEVNRINESCYTTLKKIKNKNKALAEISMVKERKKDVTQFSGLIGRTTSTRREGKENRYPEILKWKRFNFLTYQIWGYKIPLWNKII